MAAIRDDIAALRENAENKYREFQDYIYNMDVMLRALCNQDGVNLSQLRLRTPAVPLFGDTISGQSGLSVASATSPSLHIARLSIAGPSGVGIFDPPQAEGKSSLILLH
jgi:hypothetical protein